MRNSLSKHCVLYSVIVLHYQRKFHDQTLSLSPVDASKYSTSRKIASDVSTLLQLTLDKWLCEGRDLLLPLITKASNAILASKIIVQGFKDIQDPTGR